MTSQMMEDDLRVEEVTGTTPAPDSSQQELPATEQISLKPPQALFKPIEYPPLHIFVSGNIIFSCHYRFKQAYDIQGTAHCKENSNKLNITNGMTICQYLRLVDAADHNPY